MNYFNNVSQLIKEFVLHSFNDNPSFIENEKQLWHKDGELHRDNNPAVIYNGNVIRGDYYKNGNRCITIKYD